ncbi:MAG: class I SAM-dependent methyltransferase [Candidatus Thorarchaeota archaeon]|jgi:cyclopropane fatty-acyl-phospholipid synthase-like methyltransferase
MPEWDEIFSEKGRVFTKPHQDMDEIADLLQNGSVSRILDIGCGTGRHLVHLARKGFQMFGFDASQHAVNLSEEWLNEEGLSASIMKYRMEDSFPYEDMLFDAVISIQTIHHNRIRDIKSTVSEIERVLRPQGYIFITVPILTDEPVSPEDDWDLKEIEPRTYLPQKGPESGILHHYFTEDEILEVFSAFRITRMYIDETGHRCIFGTKI